MLKNRYNQKSSRRSEMKPYYQCVPVEVKGMKKTCDRCRALIESQGEALKCQLGYKIDGQKGIPLEKCTKPTTYTELIEQKRGSR